MPHCELRREIPVGAGPFKVLTCHAIGPGQGIISESQSRSVALGFVACQETGYSKSLPVAICVLYGKYGLNLSMVVHT